MLDNTLRLKNNTFCSDNCLLQTEVAYDLNLSQNSYEKLLCFLRSDSLNLVYYALLKIEYLKTKDDALFLLDFLAPDNDSRIREQASEVIKTVINDESQSYYFYDTDTVMLLIESIKDKNPKVCRNIVHILKKLNKPFQIIEKLVNIVEYEIKNCEKEQIKNKAIFTIYWCLFAVESLLTSQDSFIDVFENLIETVEKTSKFKEYQVREKSAAIVKVLNRENNNKKLLQLTEQMLNDENFYVRTAIL